MQMDKAIASPYFLPDFDRVKIIRSLKQLMFKNQVVIFICGLYLYWPSGKLF